MKRGLPALDSTVFVVNPRAGSGRGGIVWERLLESHPELRGANVVLEAEPLAAANALRAALAAGAREVIALGGDGTAHLVANVLLADGSGGRVVVGLVPGGTGADLCKTLGISGAPEAALATALAGDPRPLDAFDVRLADGSRRFCVNTVSAGVAGRVVESVNALTRRGAAVYLLTTIKALWRYRPVRCRIELEGERVHEGPVFLVAAANGVTFGKGMRVAPRARVDDGLADVVVVGELARWELPLRLAQLYLGRHLRARPVKFRQAARLRCEPLGPFTPYELDGEVGPSGPLELAVLPGALRVRR